MPDSPAREVGFGNYLVAFIDLLGQRNALAGQGILPSFKNAEQKAKFTETAKQTIGSILRLQRDSEALVDGANRKTFADIRQELPKEFHAIVDDLTGARISTQRWSDGIVYFYCLRGSNIVRDLGAIYDLVTRVGSLTLLGLATKTPVRGGLEISWGVELHPNELYGPAVANAYYLESAIAQQPRMVLGEHLVDYLHALTKYPDNDVRGHFVRNFSSVVLDLILKDSAGVPFVHFLHPEFMQKGDNPHTTLYPLAMSYIDSQIDEHANCEKLMQRYTQLKEYFLAYAP